MKRIAVLVLCFMLIATLAPVSVAGQNETVKGVTFEIPDEYSNGRSTDNAYLYINVYTFAIRALDSTQFLVDTYGDEANKDGSISDLTVGSHDVVHIVNYIGVAGHDVSFAFFACGDVIYCISWQGSDMSSEIESMIENSPDSNYTYNEFHDVLDDAEQQYLDDLSSEEESYQQSRQDEQTSLLRDIEHNTNRHHFLHHWYYYY